MKYDRAVKKKYKDDDFKSLFSVFAELLVVRPRRRIGFYLFCLRHTNKINIKITEKQHEYLILADKNVWVLLETNSVLISQLVNWRKIIITH